MATRGTGKTYEEILAEENATGKKTYDEAAAKTKETAAQKISDQSAVIDSAAQNTTAQYQKTIDEAPKRFAGQLDDNYIDELVARKNLENTMADMGLTDSGLNRGQQTAISVMRGNADAKTRQQQQDFVSAAQQAIDQVLAKAEREKASYANEANAGVEDYLAQLWATVQQNAQANATSRFNAQEESLDAAYKAQLEAEAEAEKWRVEQQNAMIRALINNEVPYNDAVAMVMGEEGDSETPDENVAISALDGVKQWNASENWALFDKTWWNGPEGDGEHVYEDIVRKQLKKSDVWLTLDDVQKAIATAKAIGKSVGTTWTSQKEKNQDKNKTRIKSALEAAGYKESEMAPDSWNTLLTFATKAYNDVY